MRRTLSVVTAALLTAAAACSDHKVGPEPTAAAPPAGWNISEPGASTTTNNLSASSTFASVADGPVTYISAEPATMPNGLSVRIRNSTLGTPFVTIDVIDGGFDPVSVPAQAGDNIEIRVITLTNDTYTLVVSVPRRRPPVIVRTNPAKGRVDVALNQVLTAVFSEPVDPLTVKASSIKLLNGGTQISGTLALAADGLSATLTPSAQLVPATNYEFVITTQLRDREGDPLGASESVTFTTVGSATPIVNVPQGPSSIRIVFQRHDEFGNGTHMYAMNGDGTNLQQFPSGPGFEGQPSVSPDGKRIAYVVDGAVHVMDADGSNDRVLFANGGSPRWSPDGAKIAFADQVSTGISIINADGTGLVKLVPTFSVQKEDFAPSWSPDGNEIVFWRWEDQEFSVVWIMNSDGTNARRVGRQDASSSGIVTWASWGPYWSPSKRIYFAGPNNSFSGTVWSMYADGANPAQHATFGNRIVMEVSDVSRDGSFVAFTLADHGLPDVYLMSAGGGSVMRLTFDGRSSSAAFLNR